MKQTTKRRWRIVLLALAALFILIQLVPYGRDHSNPPVVAEPNWDRPETRAFFFRACKDCHSNETTWPWYSHVAPVSWLVQYDVEDGRKHLNVSAWGQQRQDADESAEVVQEGEMPLWYYLPTHPEAKFTPEEKAAFQGLRATFGEEEKHGSDHKEESDHD